MRLRVLALLLVFAAPAFAQPSPRAFSVDYTVTPRGLHAAVTLPPGLAGTLLWNGNHLPLHPGATTLNLPPRLQ